MIQSIVRWLVIISVIFLVAGMVVFALIHLPPGDPALALIGGEQPWVQEARAINRDLGDRPVVIRYFLWLGRGLQRLVERARLP